MEPNLTAHYLGLTTDSKRRSQQAQRGWLIEQAAAQQPKQDVSTIVRRWLGGLMIAAGQRLQGLPGAAMVARDPAHGH